MSKNPFGNMGNIMRQAQAMQDRLAKLQEQAATKVAEGSAGGGMVTVKANGAMEIVSVRTFWSTGTATLAGSVKSMVPPPQVILG